jgi:hypothetical protein
MLKVSDERKRMRCRVRTAMHVGDVAIRDVKDHNKPWLDTGCGKSSNQVAAEIGITHQAVSLNCRSALHKIQGTLRKLNESEGGGLLEDDRFPKLLFKALGDALYERRLRELDREKRILTNVTKFLQEHCPSALEIETTEQPTT